MTTEEEEFTIDVDASDYAIACDFSTLKDPDMGHIITTELRNHTNWKGYEDEWKKVDNAAQVLRPEFWMEFGEKESALIKACIDTTVVDASKTARKQRMKIMQKELVRGELVLIQQFTVQKYMTFLTLDDLDFEDNTIKTMLLLGKWKGIFGVLASAVIVLIKQDMCSGRTDACKGINDIVKNSFSPKKEVDFSHDAMKQTIFYIAGWHITACFKAGKRRGDTDIGRMMIRLFELATIDRSQAKDLPIEKVLRTERFGGLHFVSKEYFDFIQRLEFVFVKCLTPNPILCI
jgi:hypothetical protein